jgi:predicted Mrr-cat superfamily restriction endonuclease
MRERNAILAKRGYSDCWMLGTPQIRAPYIHESQAESSQQMSHIMEGDDSDNRVIRVSHQVSHQGESSHESSHDLVTCLVTCLTTCLVVGIYNIYNQSIRTQNIVPNPNSIQEYLLTEK